MKGWVEDFGLLISRLGTWSPRTRRTWPHAPGKYFVLDANAPVALSTLANIPLAQELKNHHPKGLCIVGRTVTENVGIEKVVRNVVSNPQIRFLVLAGNEAPEHRSGQTFQALHKNGVDPQKRVRGATGCKPILKNLSDEEVGTFRKHVELVDLLGCESPDELTAEVSRLSNLDAKPKRTAVVARQNARLRVTTKWDIQLDKAGYFVIAVESDVIVVEHYDYSNNLLRSLEGINARSLYLTIVDRGWVSELGHAAYLGKELARAEHAMLRGHEYVQDAA